MRSFVVFVVLAGCECKTKPPAAPAVASGSVSAAPPYTFEELRTQRALHCLLERGDRPNAMNWMLEALATDADPVAVRAAAFALVDRARPDGTNPELAALAEAVYHLGPIGDTDGLRLAFARIDELGGEAAFSAYDEAYRGRIQRDAKPTRWPLAWTTQLGIAGYLTEAERVYTTVPAGDRGATPDHVAALAALGRDATIRELLATAAPGLRPQLVDAWLGTVARAKRPIGDAVSALLSAVEAAPMTIYPSNETLRAAGRSGDSAAAARLRAGLRKLWTPEYLQKYPGTIAEMYEHVLDAGIPGERAELEARVSPRAREREKTLRDAPLADALAFALRDGNEGWLANVWARGVRERAEAAFFARIEQAVCKDAPPSVTPAPPLAGVTLIMKEEDRETEEECEKATLVLHLVRGDEIVDDKSFDGACEGACTAAEKRAGRREVADIERRIENGEASASELDYDFTGCHFVGHRAGRLERVAGRDVALFVEQSIGPHTTIQTSHQLAFEVCGELFVSQAFGGRYTGGWQTENLVVEGDASEIRVRVASEYWSGVIYRAALPACPGSPTEKLIANDR